MKPFREDKLIIVSKMANGTYGLHGDVILSREALPADFENMQILTDGALALGEATGHSHTIFGDRGSFELREDAKTKIKYLRVVEPVALKHQEHISVKLPPGDYRIGIQREYDPFEKLTRQVAD